MSNIREAIVLCLRVRTPKALAPTCFFDRLMGVAMTLDAIVEETAQLPEDVIAELIERILVQRHGGIDLGLEAAWNAEARRRVAEIAEDKVKGIPLDESLPVRPSAWRSKGYLSSRRRR